MPYTTETQVAVQVYNAHGSYYYHYYLLHGISSSRKLPQLGITFYKYNRRYAVPTVYYIHRLP
jgi:hypothetical protein